MRVLIIGLGIGMVYVEQCVRRGMEVYSLDTDPDKKATFTSLTEAKQFKYDFVVICAPNYLHEHFIREFYRHTSLILVEKPGLQNRFNWDAMVKEIAPTKMIMVKNNMYRDYNLVKQWLPAKKIHIMWINKNRIPGPGTWFTTKDRAWGGVSYDLMPHLLHMMLSLNFKFVTAMQSRCFQKYSLKEAITTDYGSVNEKGIYDVDDHCHMSFFADVATQINLISAWKSDEVERSRLEVLVEGFDGSRYGAKFGLCPNAVYGKMIDGIISQYNDDPEFYPKHQKIDNWVIEQISNVSTERFKIKDILK